MQVSRWGDSLAVRLPADVVEAHHLKEGDQVEVVIRRSTAMGKSVATQKAALDALDSVAIVLPPDFKFDRKEANER